MANANLDDFFPLSILIAENDSSIRQGITDVLIKRGARLTVVTSEKEALDSLQMHPDCIVLDIQLADGGNGMRIAEKAALNRPIPLIIAISNRASAKEGARLGQLGVAAYIQKPFPSDTIPATIEAALKCPSILAQHIALQVGRNSYFAVLSNVRQIMLEQALANTKGNRKRAAKLLDVSRHAVQEMIKNASKISD